MEFKVPLALLLLLILAATGHAGEMDRGKDEEEKFLENEDEEEEYIENDDYGKERVLFSDKWRSIYSDEQLENQAKWHLADDQPKDGSYEVRLYKPQWWVSSYTPCLHQTTASSTGYMDLYFYLNGFNYQRFKYPLTYPVVLHVDKRSQVEEEEEAEEEYETSRKRRAVNGAHKGGKGKGKGGKGKRRRGPMRQPKGPKVCPTRHTLYLYLPVQKQAEIALTENEKISFSKTPLEKFYVREYTGNYTSAFCNEQFSLLTRSLVTNNIWVDSESWYCAQYEPGTGSSEPRYEVWMKERLD